MYHWSISNSKFMWYKGFHSTTSFSPGLSSLIQLPTDMKTCLSAGIVPLLIVAPSVLGALYPLSDTIIGSTFYNAFNFEAIADPSHGRVYVSWFSSSLPSLIFRARNYVDQPTAQRLNLTFASSDAFILRADSTTMLSASGPGRNSVRIRSKKAYTTHVAVFVSHVIPTSYQSVDLECQIWYSSYAPRVWVSVKHLYSGHISNQAGQNLAWSPGDQYKHTAERSEHSVHGCTKLHLKFSPCIGKDWYHWRCQRPIAKPHYPSH